MGRIMMVMAACLLAGGAAAQPVYKCTAGGKVSYSEHPCANGTALALPAPPAPAGAADAAAKLARDKARLAALERKRRAETLAEARAGERAAKAAAARIEKCERLRLKQKWALDDVARSGREATDAARLKAQRQAEALAVECPA